MTNRYYSPFLINLQNFTGIPTISTSKKKDLLIRELFINIANASDILFNILAIVARDILFLATMAQDICKAILGAGNIALGIDEIPTKVL